MHYAYADERCAANSRYSRWPDRKRSERVPGIPSRGRATVQTLWRRGWRHTRQRRREIINATLPAVGAVSGRKFPPTRDGCRWSARRSILIARLGRRKRKRESRRVENWRRAAFPFSSLQRRVHVRFRTHNCHKILATTPDGVRTVRARRPRANSLWRRRRAGGISLFRASPPALHAHRKRPARPIRRVCACGVSCRARITCRRILGRGCARESSGKTRRAGARLTRAFRPYAHRRRSVPVPGVERRQRSTAVSTRVTTVGAIIVRRRYRTREFRAIPYG